MEWHTSDLSADCLKSVELRLNGKRDTLGMTTALYLGQLFHAAARIWHEDRDKTVEGCVLAAAPIVEAGALDEGRPLTPAVVSDQSEHWATVSRWLARYVQVYPMYFPDVFPETREVYCEVPIRLTLEVDGEDVEFASHLDCLIISPDGSATVLDWKTGADAPTWEYLSRNMQLSLYYLAVKYGRVKIGEGWQKLRAEPRVCWVHVRNLEPYGKKGEYKDGDNVVQYVKGDFRPNHKVFQFVTINNDNAIIDEFATRVRMQRAGLWPTNPTETGCFLCESKKYCPQFTGESNGNV